MTAPLSSDGQVDTAFEKLLGRQPSAEERANLYRVRDALGLRGNDALWLVLLALESYDVRFRAYPEQLAAATAQACRDLPAAISAAVCQELGPFHGFRAVGPAPRLLPPLAVLGVAAATLVAFGALCMLVGATAAETNTTSALAQRLDPTWPASYRLACAVLAMPAGWMVFVLLLPFAGLGLWRGWKTATDAFADRRRRWAGGALIALSAAVTAATCVVLGRVL